MSTTPEQMKLPCNLVKNADEGNIPWSQQVDEASYENLASPTADENADYSQSSTQFQYPPFNVKENPESSWNNNKSRKPSANLDTNKKYGKPSFYNKRNDSSNAWTSQTSKKTCDDSVGAYNSSFKGNDGHDIRRSDNGKAGHQFVEEKKSNVAAAPKKTTWASIASQPAKLASRTVNTTSTHKKKGPGMPPPPMVPGKHNLDITAWDIPNNNPPPVPSPPLPIDQPHPEMPLDISAGLASEPIFRTNKGQKVTNSIKEDDKNSFTNFGRPRNSSNGVPRKNWHVQPNIQPQTRLPEINSVGGMKRGELNPGGRYNERRNQYAPTRSDQDYIVHDQRDENHLRNPDPLPSAFEAASEVAKETLDELRVKNNYNPTDIDLEMAACARFFVIKSYSEDDIHRSIKYEIWCSTDHGNKRLDDAFKERQQEGGNILLFFSVNGSGHFCGMAQMMTPVDYNSTSSVWSQDKWKGKFKVKWVYVKDVPNKELRHIRLENNENKSVTHSRDTQEVPNVKGIEVLQILHSFKHKTSIFDDFNHYERKQEEEVFSKKPLPYDNTHISQNLSSPTSRYRQNDERDKNRIRGDNRNSGTQRHYAPPSNLSNYRDRTNIHRNSYHNNFPDRDRRLDRDIDGDKTDKRLDFTRRDERFPLKHNRDRDRDRDAANGEHKNDARFRETQKANFDWRNN